MEQRDTPIIFLAMFWGGGGPYTIPEIIHAYDWINRDVPDREQMESALNTLLAMGLIEKQDDRFRVNRSRGQEFDVFRKKKRKSKFKMVRMYFRQLPTVTDIPRIISLSDNEYRAHILEYRRAFD